MTRLSEVLKWTQGRHLWTANRRHAWIVPCVILCGAALTFNFSGYPLLDPDEGRNAEIAREMAAGSGYILPRLNGVPYLDKPVLFFAAAAVSIEFLGPAEFAVRLPSLLFTLATLVIVGWFAARLFGMTAAWTAVIATAATPFTLAYSRTVIFDSTLTFFVSLALCAFYLAVDAAGRTGEGHDARSAGAIGVHRAGAGNLIGQGNVATGWTTLAWAAMASGVLTKGPIAVALPLMVALPFAYWRRAWRAILDPLSLLVFVALTAPWLSAVSRRIPDFLHYALVTETARRLTSTELQRTGPIWYFMVILPAAALPWSLVVLGAWRTITDRPDRNGGLDRRVVYLLLWLAIPLVFFSLSQSKRPQYVLPLVAAVALLVAAAWNASRARLPGARFAAAATLLLGIIILVGSGRISSLLSVSNDIARAIPTTAIMLGAACILSGSVAWLAAHRRGVVMLAFLLPIAVVPYASRDLMEAIGEERSAATMAETIDSIAGPEARVVGVSALPLSLPFYLQRTVLLATADASELTSNYIVRHFDEYLGKATLRPADWWRAALVECGEPTVFVVRREDRESRSILRARLDIVFQTRRYAVFGPCGMATLALAGT
jgi:4-amino-4-deoxy-L-arabinose transferase-like glycosyltransferase